MDCTPRFNHDVKWIVRAVDDKSIEIDIYRQNECLNIEHLTIPSILNGKSVVSIRAKFSLKKLLSVAIPSSIKDICMDAFDGCDVLTTIDVDPTNPVYKSVAGCLFTKDGKKIVKVPVGIPLERMTIPVDVVQVERGAFRGCAKLKEVIIGNGVASIGEGAFAGCVSLERILIPDGLMRIGSNAFSGCAKLKEVTIGKGVTSIEGRAFAGCASLERIVIPDGLMRIGSNLFRGCAKLKEVIIGRGVTSIEDGTFAGCVSLERITIPDGVTCIGSWPLTLRCAKGEAFYGCVKLKEVTIGKGVASVGEKAFAECASLERIVIPDRVKSIGSNSFRGCAKLKEVTIGRGVTSIGEEAFAECVSLERITIPESVKTILDSAFSGCISLKEVTMQGGDVGINPGAFENCTRLAGFTVVGVSPRFFKKPNGDNVFGDKPALKCIVIRDCIAGKEQILKIDEIDYKDVEMGSKLRDFGYYDDDKHPDDYYDYTPSTFEDAYEIYGSKLWDA